MSIRSLFSTSVSATESAVVGIVNLGSSIGEGSTWLQRQAKQLNSDDTIRREELRRKIDTIKDLNSMLGLKEATAEDLKSAIKEVEEVYGEIFK